VPLPRCRWFRTTTKPTQEGLYRHFVAVAEAVDLPMIVYNVPGRTVADLNVDTTLRLAAGAGIVGLKDATGDLARAGQLLRRLPVNFALYSGNDDSALALMLLGGHGVISVTANVAPAFDETDVRRPRCRRILPKAKSAECAADAAAYAPVYRAQSDPGPNGRCSGWAESPVAFACRWFRLSASGREAVQAALDEVELG